MAGVEVLEQARLGRLPAEELTGERIGRRAVEPHEPAIQVKCAAAWSGVNDRTGSSR